MLDLSSHINRLKSSVFARQIGILSGGNAVSYVIAFTALPILTRIFPKEAFDWLTLYLSIISVGGVVISLQYEQAIVVCKEKTEVAKLFLLAILSATVITLIFGVIIFGVLQIDSVAKNFENYPTAFILYTLFGTWIAAIYQSTMQALNKLQQYKLMSINKISVALITILIQFFLWKNPFLGIMLALVIGHVFGKGISLLLAFKHYIVLIKEAISYSYKSYKQVVVKFKDFQHFNLVAVIIDRIAFELPVFLITLWFTESLADYGMAYRVLMVPMALFCTSYSQVFMRKASDLWNDGSDIRPLIKNTWLLIGGLLIIPFLLLVLFGSQIFALLFGDEWATAGSIAAILVPFQWFSAMSSTTSVTFSVIRKQRYMLIFSFLSVLYRVASFSIGFMFGSINTALIAFSISHITALFIYNTIMLRNANPAIQTLQEI